VSIELPKYAELENERRFLVVTCPDLSTAASRLIEDAYISHSRLRLRAITHADGAREFKLCKKYESLDPTSGPIVNIYLSAAEYAVLSSLQGRPLRKRRHRVAWRDRSFSVDVFEDELAGLVLCEAEAESADAIGALEFPSWASLDVTADRFYTGGNLAYVTADELKARLNARAA
jgi:CYTH domain-containing protein